ncbi:MAG TPA: tRNA lysidine(34) synthetase TilS [Actinomycetota bacterium]|nr:tRNA lysidine(34) synthetase TilS [Actinomycetota bacterium]
MTATVREHGLLQPDEAVLVCVSGGPDSVCLLESLVRLRRLLRVRIEVFHFDHRLRPGSSVDAAYVRRLAVRHRLPFHVRAAQDAPSEGSSVEAWATTRRTKAANDVRREIGASVVAEGHTLDDQAETVLLNLVRGAGLDGLAGIWPGEGDRPGSSIVQPLLEVTRAEVEAFCRSLGLRPRRDPMNEDRRLLRAAIRHEAIPMLERITGREVRATLARTAAVLHEDRLELLRQAAEHEAMIVERHGGEVRFRAADLDALPRSLAARIVRMALWRLAAVDDEVAPWTRDSVDAVLDLAAGRPGRRRDLPGGRAASRDRVYVRVTSPGETAETSTEGEHA